jgi:hypothetical protein
MAKSVHDNVLDAALDYVKQNADRMVVCEGQPVSYAEATTDKGSGGKKLADVAVVSGDFTISDGDASGRKVRVAQKTGITVDVSGTADHIATVDDTSSALLRVTTISNSQAITAAGTVDINAHDQEIGDPT